MSKFAGRLDVGCRSQPLSCFGISSDLSWVISPVQQAFASCSALGFESRWMLPDMERACASCPSLSLARSLGHISLSLFLALAVKAPQD